MNLLKTIDKINSYVLGGVLSITFFSFGFSRYQFRGLHGDVSEIFNNAFRAFNGDMPYRDFWMLFPPGDIALPVFLFKHFGATIDLYYVLLPFVVTALGVGGFILGKLLFKRNVWGILLGLVLFMNNSFELYAPFSLVAAIVFIAFIQEYFSEKQSTGKQTALLMLSGIAISLCFFFKFYLAGTIAAAMLITLAYIAITADNRRHLLSWLVIFFASFLAGAVILFYPYFSVFSEMVHSVVIEGVRHGTSMNLPYFNFLHTVPSIDTARLGASLIMSANTLHTYILFLLPFIVIPISIYFLRRESTDRKIKAIVLFLVLWGTLAFMKSLGRSSVESALFNTVPLAVLSFVILYNSSKKQIKKVLIVCIVLLLMGIPLFAQNYVFNKQAQHYSIYTDNGTTYFYNPVAAHDFQLLIDYIQENSTEDDYIFATEWYMPPLYIMSNRKNPTYYDSLIDVVARPSAEKQQSICADLLEHNTKFVITQGDLLFDGKQSLSLFRTNEDLINCIVDNSETAEEIGPYMVFTLKQG